MRQCINAMHVEKNVCYILIGTLLNINEKMNDEVNAYLDFIKISISEELTR